MLFYLCSRHGFTLATVVSVVRSFSGRMTYQTLRLQLFHHSRQSQETDLHHLSEHYDSVQARHISLLNKNNYANPVWDVHLLTTEFSIGRTVYTFGTQILHKTSTKLILHSLWALANQH